MNNLSVLLVHQTNSYLDIYYEMLSRNSGLTLSALVLLADCPFASIENPDRKIYGIQFTLSSSLCSRL